MARPGWKEVAERVRADVASGALSYETTAQAAARYGVSVPTALRALLAVAAEGGRLHRLDGEVRPHRGRGTPAAGPRAYVWAVL